MVSRRTALAAGLTALAGAALAGCDAAPPPAPGSQWTYTDARGKRVVVDHLPRRIVAYSGIIGALADYGVPFVGVYGPHSSVDGRPNPLSGDAKFAGVASFGERYEDLSVEKLLALRPDLVLEPSFVAGGPFYLPAPVLARLEQTVPVALVDASPSTPLPALLDRFTQLAMTLGGVIDMPQQRAARAGFDQATAAIRDGLGANRNLRVLTVSATPQRVYLVRPDSVVGLQYLRSLGMNVVDPPHVGTDDDLTPVPAERLGAYPADVILYDTRPRSLSLDRLRALPAFRDLPAVRAGQTAPWNPEVPFSYQQWAKVLTPVASWVGQFRPGIV